MHEFGHAADLAIGVDAGEDTGAFGEQTAVGGTGQSVGMLNFRGGNAGTVGFEEQLFVILGRVAVFESSPPLEL